MQLLHIERLEQAGPVTVLFGTVQNERISVGQNVTLVAPDGCTEPVTVVALMPNDDATPGTEVKVLIKRRDPLLELAVGMSLRKA